MRTRWPWIVLALAGAAGLYMFAGDSGGPKVEARIRFLIPVESTTFSTPEGPVPRGLDYGLTAIAHVQNRGKSTIHVTALKVEGEVDLGIAEYAGLKGYRGRSVPDLEAELKANRPYWALAWNLSPDGGPVAIQPRETERYVVFTVMEPRFIAERLFAGKEEDYVGYRSANAPPKLLTVSPHLNDLVKFTTMSQPDNRLEEPQLRPAVLDGSIRVILATSEGDVLVKPDSLLAPSSTTLKDLRDTAAYDLFRGKN